MLRVQTAALAPVPRCRYELPVSITPNQNLILRDINPSWKDDILSTLQVRPVVKSVKGRLLGVSGLQVLCVFSSCPPSRRAAVFYQ